MCNVCLTLRVLFQCVRRARAYACTRQWDFARSDYNSVLLHRHEHPEALKGLQDIQDTVIMLPMLSDGLLDNESS